MNSFFESLDTEEFMTLWGPAPDRLEGSIQYSGNLYKHSRVEKELVIVKRFFYIQGNYLLYKTSAESAKASAAMNIKFARFEILDESNQLPEIQPHNYKLGVKISRGLKFSVLYAQTQKEFDQWISVLTKQLMRNDIHQRFTTEKVIGAGAFAQVFRARENATGHQYAVKGFNKTALLENEIGKASLWKEIGVLRSIAGAKNMVDLKEVHETKNSIYLIMELIEGGDLLSFINSKKHVSEETFVNIAYGLLRSILFLAQNNLFHRDIKPANIMLRKTHDVQPEDIVIVDFGLAAQGSDSDFLFKRCGTPGYIAPELISMKTSEEGFEIPSKSDIYSAGVTLYYLATGQPLFDKEEYSCSRVLRENLMSRISFSQERFTRYTKDVMDLLRSLLQPNPEKRASITQAVNHKVFYCFKEEFLDSSMESMSIEENDIEESSSPARSLIRSDRTFLIRNRVFENLVLENSASFGESKRSFDFSVRGSQVRKQTLEPVQKNILQMKANRDTVATANSPVTSQSNGISKGNCDTSNSGISRLAVAPSRFLVNRSLFSRTVVTPAKQMLASPTSSGIPK